MIFTNRLKFLLCASFGTMLGINDWCVKKSCVVITEADDVAPLDTVLVDDSIEALDDTIDTAGAAPTALGADAAEESFEFLLSSEGISSKSLRVSVNSRISKSSPISRKSPSPIPRSPNSLPT